MTRFEKRVAKMRKEYLAKVAERDRLLAEEQAKLEAEKKIASESLSDLTVDELKALAKEKGLTGYSDLKKDELIEELKAVD